MPGADELAKVYRLMGADGTSFVSSAKGAFGGNRRTKVYGLLDCSIALRHVARGAYAKSRVFFADEASAVAAGYRACSHCMKRRTAAASH
jgi:methylphosphotriester-DNA--protein-cysteine methyltransferase